MHRKIITSIGVAVGLVVIALSVYLISAQKQVAAPTLEDMNSQQLTGESQPPSFKGNEDAFKNALNLYIQKKKDGTDMSSGPCLGKIAEGWVLDIAHNPRQPIDNKPENQCADIREGRASHFIELDPDGKLIKSY